MNMIFGDYIDSVDVIDVMLSRGYSPLCGEVIGLYYEEYGDGFILSEYGAIVVDKDSVSEVFPFIDIFNHFLCDGDIVRYKDKEWILCYSDEGVPQDGCFYLLALDDESKTCFLTSVQNISKDVFLKIPVKLIKKAREVELI